MPNSREEPGSSSSQGSLKPPVISLPKGGGAIRGIGEKFAANPVTGTGSMTVPIATSPGRSGFAPQLNLSYDSGSGNGPFGFGWSLSISSITRKTDKGLPRYDDANESDVFILSGAEDLVPVIPQPSIPTVSGYDIKHYRPRIEGLFARIERWASTSNGEVYWRSISRDNITTWYGKTAQSRIADPGNPERIFSWLICESYDDKGNAIFYMYKQENDQGVDLSRANERNRLRAANQYLKRIKYGNKTPRTANEDLSRRDDWLFEVVFDYGEHYTQNALGEPTAVYLDDNQLQWDIREDPFSSYRAGFEVRTNRLCQRVLMFHHFRTELDVDDYLVRSTEFKYVERSIASFITKVVQSGYILQDGNYLKRSLPPLEFKYSEATIDDTIREIDPASLENLPIGLDGSQYQWVDLDGEGLSGILTEQVDSWLYKRNLSANNLVPDNDVERTVPQFGPLELVAAKPNAALSLGAFQFLDLAGDGRLDLVAFKGAVPGFYARAEDQAWEPFSTFKSLPKILWNDPNLRFVDITGDGRADILITEEHVFTWYPSLAEAGFDRDERTVQAFDEEQGPHLVFADGTQSIYLADLSGDGLTDLVRIRNGEICYWPNLGYGRFGAKVTMDNSPWLDAPDLFDQKRIRLADIDGSGTTDMIYLGGKGVVIYFNECGNGWSAPLKLKNFPKIDDHSSVVATDLLGNGTACLVWSSSLPGNGCRPMRYIDLMGGQKPHLLIETRNNLGAKTMVQYAPSTKFYLQDKQNGKPWITRLPFPVHCVEEVKVTDKWRMTEFASTYSYHHGCYDGFEREFRGFGRVEQIDVETFDKFAAGNASSPYITNDLTLYQPPVKTVTWHHTGAFIDRQKILTQFSNEYFQPYQEHQLPEPNLQGASLTAEEWREALRACKGMVLRQEVYELDVDAWLSRQELPVKLFTTAFHNCEIKLLQSMAANRHAVFHVTESEAITYHYEMDLRQPSVTPDPRIAHTLNLKTDEYGNLLQSVAVVYPRIGQHADSTFTADQNGLINEVQHEKHLSYSENHYTDDINDVDNHRLRLLCEARTYELTGIPPANGFYYDLAELRSYRLSDTLPGQGSKPVGKLEYHELPNGGAPQKRLVEHTRTLFFVDDPADTANFLVNPLPPGKLGRLGLPYEQYRLALTRQILDAIFTNGQLNWPVPGDDTLPETGLDKLNHWQNSGYLSGSAATARFGPEAADQYWIRSGIAGFASDAAGHFYLPERYTDPFGNETSLSFDANDLYIESSQDPVGNIVRVEQFDFRVLQPSQMKDPNGNLSEVYFDILGLPTAMALKGKGDEADNLDSFDATFANPELDTLIAFFTGDYDEAEARLLLGDAMARHVYYFGEKRGADGSITWENHPACACGILREKHVAQLDEGNNEQSPLQTAFEYSDGMGAVLVKKVQAEPDEDSTDLRWIANGKTILNNKGKPVKQYEPYFSQSEHRFEESAEVGVTPILYYDAAGRLVRTELPDGTLSRVEFSPWQVESFDQNDTVTEGKWYADLTPPDPDKPLPRNLLTGELTVTPDQRAAWLAAQHRGTPNLIILDSLGREVIAIAHNRVKDASGQLQDEKLFTFTRLDAEGKPLWIRDARKNLVMQYITPIKPTRASDEPDQSRIEDIPVGSAPCYDIAGNLLFQHSMDAGDRWILNDAAGKPMLAWDVNEFQGEDNTISLQQRLYFTEYDALHRPFRQWLGVDGSPARLVEYFVYGEDAAAPADPQRNLRGQVYRHYDPGGLTENTCFDFKGNLLEGRRRLASDVKADMLDWQANRVVTAWDTDLEAETFVHITEYDALNRMTRLYNWHQGTGSRVAVYEPRYNERGLLAGEELVIRARKTADGYDLVPSSPGVIGSETTPAIQAIRYNAKGQKEFIEHGNGTLTRYDYDPRTFRLRQLRTSRPKYDPDFPQYHSGLKDDQVLQQLHYTYDPVGNITEIYDEAYEPVFFQNQKVEPVSRYEYDALYRLIAASGRENGITNGAPVQFEDAPVETKFPIPSGALRTYTEEYQYDEVGNFIQMRHAGGSNGSWNRNYETAADSNRLLRTWEGADTWGSSAAINKITYEYDTHGNMLNLGNVAVSDQMRWDTRDMIHSLNLLGGGWAYYNYDAGKQRTRKRMEREWTVEERIYLGGLERYRKYDAQGNVVEEIETLHLFEGEQRLLLVDDIIETDNTAMQAGPLYRYQYNNHLGSACLELDDTAGIISYEEYHPYGTSAYHAVKSGIEAPLKRYRYTGKERDDESGLDYYGARYYASWFGMWVSCDPVGTKDNLNLYQYCNTNPIVLIDPNGSEVGGFWATLGGYFYGVGEAFYDTGHFFYKVTTGMLNKTAEGLPTSHFYSSYLDVYRAEEYKRNNEETSQSMDAVVSSFESPEKLVSQTWKGIVTPLDEMSKDLNANKAPDAARNFGRFVIFALAAFKKKDVQIPRIPESPALVPALATGSIQTSGISVMSPSSIPIPIPNPSPLMMASGSKNTPRGSSSTKQSKTTQRQLKELEDIRKRIDDLSANAIGIALAERVARTCGRFGTNAHSILEYFVNEFNNELIAARSKFSLTPEVFFNRLGNVVGRRAPLSLGVDIQLKFEGIPIEEFDLKTGAPWSLKKAALVERRTPAPVTQVGPYAP